MRNPVVWGIIYFAVGVAFTYMAIQNPGNMWSFYSILLMVFAAYNINIALKMFAFSVKLKKQQQK
ncbi:YdiK family protein [Bacillus pumilus]|uniref:YdiK family protein n=1 Tax=Bacillus pumilus TaxID=1408 RepID=UPI003F43AB2D